MKFILFEVYYRCIYIITGVCFIECFLYLVQGPQLEYFSGLFTFSYQIIDFDYNGDIKQLLISQKKFLLNHQECFLQSSTELKKLYFVKQTLLNVNSFFTLSSNEAKSWFYLFINYLSYFYCLEIKKHTFYCLSVYIKVIYISTFSIIQIYSIFLPGILKRSFIKQCLFFYVVYFSIVMSLNKYTILLFFFVLEELLLEQLDSELI